MSALRVLMVHNAYQRAGGEDGVVAAETALLRRHGHEVIEMRRDNHEVAAIGRPRLAAQTVWSCSTQRDALALLREHRPDVVHVHNTLPLISPSVYWACAAAGVPVVQTLHNFRLACPQAMFLREGKVCERCLGRMPLPALLHGCYRNSRAQTAVVVGMLAVHRTLRTFERKVTRYIALNEFCRGKFVQAGLPAERIAVKPNFADVDAPPPGPQTQRSGLLFVGRLAPEKGIDVLRQAWPGPTPLRLRVVGDGPDAPLLATLQGVQMLGPRTPAQVLSEMAGATALVLPSICYENFPRTLVEAFGSGLPVIASRIGALAELVEHGRTGLHFAPGDPADLSRVMRWAQAHPQHMAVMGANARARYESHYTPDINHRQLLAIYRSAIDDTRSTT